MGKKNQITNNKDSVRWDGIFFVIFKDLLWNTNILTWLCLVQISYYIFDFVFGDKNIREKDFFLHKVCLDL